MLCGVVMAFPQGCKWPNERGAKLAPRPLSSVLRAQFLVARMRHVETHMMQMAQELHHRIADGHHEQGHRLLSGVRAESSGCERSRGFRGGPAMGGMDVLFHRDPGNECQEQGMEQPVILDLFLNVRKDQGPEQDNNGSAHIGEHHNQTKVMADIPGVIPDDYRLRGKRQDNNHGRDGQFHANIKVFLRCGRHGSLLGYGLTGHPTTGTPYNYFMATSTMEPTRAEIKASQR